MEKQKEDRMSEEDVKEEGQSSAVLILLAFIITAVLFAVCVSSCSLRCGVCFDVKELSAPLESEVDAFPPLSM
jgi:hypothetical protein